MKKLFLASFIVLGSLGFSSCGGNETATEATDAEAVESTVIDSDTAVTELEVEKTVVEADTNTTTETIDVEENQ